jgi:periplasmic divalent cation tolerance protein
LSDVHVVLMTAPSAEIAESIVSKLVDERLIACGNITTPVTSIYMWQGVSERSAEVLVLLKTPGHALERVTERIAQLHPYDVPEVIALPVSHGLPAYLDWVQQSVPAGGERT